MFFTRLPLWRLYQPPQEAYRSVVEWWPLVGWVTGGVMAAVLYLSNLIFPYTIAVLLAVCARLLLTGALHEDGLADFFDGFGGGGTYGTLGLIIYVALLFVTLVALPPRLATLTILAADPYAKMLSAQVVQMLPYARDEQTAKSGIVYRKYNLWAGLRLALQGLLPLVLLNLSMSHFPLSIIYLPALLSYVLFLYIRKRLGGYTGDCCGALFLLTELSFYLAFLLPAEML